MTREEHIYQLIQYLQGRLISMCPASSLYWQEHWEEVIKLLEQEPKTGYWISTETKGVRYAFWCRYKCSLCGELSDHTNFCPNCGSRNEVEE